jgi:hypothetical protein
MPIICTFKNVTVAHLAMTDNGKSSIRIHDGSRDHRWTECWFIHVQASQEGEYPMRGSKNTPPGSVAMSLSNVLALLTLACLFASVSVAGEDPPLDLSLAPGMRVRVLVQDISPSIFVGTISRVGDQSVTIDVPGRSEPISVLREKIARLDVSSGRRSRWVDAAIGAGIGAAGSALACSSGENKHSFIVNNTDVTAGCALVGGLIGAAIGAAIPPGEHWNEMPATRYRVGFAPRLDHGLNVAIAGRF